MPAATPKPASDRNFARGFISYEEHHWCYYMALMLYLYAYLRNPSDTPSKATPPTQYIGKSPGA